jgi:hypothetical protein
LKLEQIRAEIMQKLEAVQAAMAAQSRVMVLQNALAYLRQYRNVHLLLTLQQLWANDLQR